MANEKDKEKKETIEVEKSQLQELINKVKRLEAVADQGRLQMLDDVEKQKNIIPTARVNYWNDKPVYSFSLIKNNSFINGQGELVQQQVLEVVYKDGKKDEFPYIDFYRNKIQKTGRVVEQTKDKKNGGLLWTIQMPDGEEHKINVKYLN